MIEIQNTGDSKAAMTIAVVFHIAILLWLLFGVNWLVPDPPLDERQVMLSLADFGMDNSGSGNVESENPSETEQVEEVPQTTETVTESTPAQEVITQEESTVSTTTSTNTTETESTSQEPEISSELDNILGQISNGGEGDGDSNTAGNEGIETGQIEGKGVFDGGGGWALTGHGLKTGPTLGDAVTEEGTVVLDIYVDKHGNVIDTKRNYGKSNTSSDKLFRLAEKAAKTVKFTSKSDAPSTYKKKGSMTFIFKLN